jgi:hypothetical protein
MNVVQRTDMQVGKTILEAHQNSKCVLHTTSQAMMSVGQPRK